MAELADELRARIASRWASAAEFYAGRDDRTVRGVGSLSGYAERPVEIYVDPSSAEDVTVQRIALVAANLTARWARRLRVVVPESALLDETLRRHGATTLRERLEWEMAMADPFGDRSAYVGGRALRLFVGPWGEQAHAMGPDDFQVHAASWSALGRRGSDVVRGTTGAAATEAEATVAAAGLAGALGAADLFKRAIGHERDRWLRTFAWDTWSSELVLGDQAWKRIVVRDMPAVLEWGRTLLAGVGAIGSAIVYVADLMPMSGGLIVLDRDAVEISNLNRSPLFTVLDAFEDALKTEVARRYLQGRGVEVDVENGVWSACAERVGEEPFDVWISLTNEHGAWAEVPFQLPPVVLHGTTTSGWGFGAGRHIPRVEDCTLCRMPRPQEEFRGPCATGEIGVMEDVKRQEPVRASLPFLSVAAAALVLSQVTQLSTAQAEAAELSNDVSVDLSAGLPAVVALHRGPTAGCRGCRAARSRVWESRGGRGRFAGLSDLSQADSLV